MYYGDYGLAENKQASLSESEITAKSSAHVTDGRSILKTPCAQELWNHTNGAQIQCKSKVAEAGNKSNKSILSSTNTCTALGFVQKKKVKRMVWCSQEVWRESDCTTYVYCCEREGNWLLIQCVKFDRYRVWKDNLVELSGSILPSQKGFIRLT